MGGCLELDVLLVVGSMCADDVENVVWLLACAGRLRTASSVASSLKRSPYALHGCHSVFAQIAGVLCGLSVVVVGVEGWGSRKR